MSNVRRLGLPRNRPYTLISGLSARRARGRRTSALQMGSDGRQGFAWPDPCRDVDPTTQLSVSTRAKQRSRKSRAGSQQIAELSSQEDSRMHRSKLSTVVIDCQTNNLARFWSAALGRKVDAAEKRATNVKFGSGSEELDCVGTEGFACEPCSPR